MTSISNNNGLCCNFNDLFPNKISFIVFISYMALFINQGLLVTATKNADNSYNYNTISVVLMTEIVKLIAAALIYLKDQSFNEMIKEINENRNVLLKYFIPSSLYCLYNNLTFINLSSYDPTTYFLLLQFRVVVTGVIFQILFSKKLSNIQWLSLILLTSGCIIKQINHATSGTTVSAESDDTFSKYFNINLILILVQVFASCFAGVYNEYLLKDSNKTHIMIQNIFMYIDSIICNVILLLLFTNQTASVTFESFKTIFQFKVLIIIINNAAIGIVTSLFLKSLNSILKSFASALELMFTGILSWILFNSNLDVYTCISILIVSLSTWLYSRNPVHNPPKSTVNEKSEDSERLV